MLMVRVAMQLMGGHMIKASTTTRKFIKNSHWLLKVSVVSSAAGLSTFPFSPTASSKTEEMKNTYLAAVIHDREPATHNCGTLKVSAMKL